MLQRYVDMVKDREKSAVGAGGGSDRSDGRMMERLAHVWCVWLYGFQATMAAVGVEQRPIDAVDFDLRCLVSLPLPVSCLT